MTVAKYEIPAGMLAWIADVPSVVLHKGVYVNTADSFASFPADESLCAFCDGCRDVTCGTCEGDGALVAKTPTPVWDEDDQTHYDEYEETRCPDCKDGSVRCPQSRTRWCHDYG